MIPEVVFINFQQAVRIDFKNTLTKKSAKVKNSTINK
jgi:hypothetical protein